MRDSFISCNRTGGSHWSLIAPCKQTSLETGSALDAQAVFIVCTEWVQQRDEWAKWEKMLVFFFFPPVCQLWHCVEFKESDLNLNSIHTLAFGRVELPTKSHSGTMQAVGMFFLSHCRLIFSYGWETGSSPSILFSLYSLLLFGHLGIL